MSRSLRFKVTARMCDPQATLPLTGFSFLMPWFPQLVAQMVKRLPTMRETRV